MYDGTLARANQRMDKGMTRNWLAQRTVTFSGLLRMIVRLLLATSQKEKKREDRVIASLLPAFATLCFAPIMTAVMMELPLVGWPLTRGSAEFLPTNHNPAWFRNSPNRVITCRFGLVGILVLCCSYGQLLVYNLVHCKMSGMICSSTGVYPC